MIRSDVELISTIYALYLYECIHWIREDTVAYTRLYAGGWRRWETTKVSFTLMRRLPCVVSLIPIVWGFVSFPRQSSLDDVIVRLEALDHAEDQLYRLLCRASLAEGVVLLVLVPAAVLLNQLEHLWMPLLAAVLVSHLATVVLFAKNLRRWEQDPHSRRMALIPVCVNPVAAVRGADILPGKKLAAIKD